MRVGTWNPCRRGTSPRLSRSSRRSRRILTASPQWSSCSWAGIPHLGRFQIEGSGRRPHRPRDSMRLTEIEQFSGQDPRHPFRRRAPTGLRLPRLGTTTPRPAAGRADVEPGHLSPDQGARPSAATRRRRPNGGRGHPRPKHGGALLRPSRAAERADGCSPTGSAAEAVLSPEVDRVELSA